MVCYIMGMDEMEAQNQIQTLTDERDALEREAARLARIVDVMVKSNESDRKARDEAIERARATKVYNSLLTKERNYWRKAYNNARVVAENTARDQMKAEMKKAEAHIKRIEALAAAEHDLRCKYEDAAGQQARLIEAALVVMDKYEQFNLRRISATQAISGVRAALGVPQ